MRPFVILSIILCSFTSFAEARSVVILDVRTPAEFNEGHLQGARQLDFFDVDFRTRLAKLDKDVEYKIYCKSGGRARKASRLMSEMGFKHVESLGGLNEARSILRLPLEGKLNKVGI
ncbi:MAG: rhodanese-like domain-containing protein [Bdellovibrionales bacterium]